MTRVVQTIPHTEDTKPNNLETYPQYGPQAAPGLTEYHTIGLIGNVYPAAFNIKLMGYPAYSSYPMGTPSS